MMIKAVLSLSLILLPLYTSAVMPFGSWIPIKDVKDPHVIKIGEFAVSEYNKQSKSTLKFQSVLHGYTQVVAGTRYRLTLAVNNDGAGEIKNYEAIVLEVPWQHMFTNLTSFKPAHGGGFL